MVKYNELIIDGVGTSSFPFDVIVLEGPTIQVGLSKDKLLSHDGVSGYIVQSNPHREAIEKKYTLQLINPTELQVLEFVQFLSKRNFWLENQQNKLTRWFCYQTKVSDTQRDKTKMYSLEVTFICHPTKYMKNNDVQTLTSNGVLRLQGSSLAFPKITIKGNSSSETSFTIGNQTIKLEQLSESAVMVNDPQNPSFLDKKGNLVKWSGDFITIDANQIRRLLVWFWDQVFNHLSLKLFGGGYNSISIRQKCSNSEMEWATTP